MTNINMPQFPEPYWRVSVTLPTYPKLNEPLNVDVGIVGGGITGITAGYLLAKQNIKVALFDAGVILNGTTGHTTAKITAQHGLIYDEFIQHFGTEKAGLYYKAQMEAKQMIKNNIANYGIDCDYKQENAYLYTNSDAYLSALEKEVKAYRQLEIPHKIVEQLPLDIPIKTALALEKQAQFHPLKYLNGLIQEAEKNGLKIYEQTTAVDVEYVKHPAIITKDGHRVTCNYVIQASQYPFYDGQGFYPTRMYPERAYIIAVKTNNAYPGGMYINAESPTRTIRSTALNNDSNEELLLIGGENHKTGQGKSTINHYETLQSYAENTFGIKDYLYRWSAQDLTTLDKLPYIGKVTGGQDSVFVATGYRKWGMTNGTIAAKVITDLITNKSSPYEELFSPSRFQANPALKSFIKVNADVAKHLIKGKLEYTNENITNLSTDEATITRINGQRTGVYKDTKSNLYGVDTTCKHLGCEVEWNSGERTWDCPCHGSRYSYTGEVINGPATESLDKVDIEES